jgi:hypothetical protein
MAPHLRNRENNRTRRQSTGAHLRSVRRPTEAELYLAHLDGGHGLGLLRPLAPSTGGAHARFGFIRSSYGVGPKAARP